MDDVSSDGPAGETNKMWVYVDRLTGEQIHLNKKVKQALIRAVLGTDGNHDNIIPLLKKRDVSEEVIEKTRADQIHLKKLMSMDAQDFRFRKKKSECWLRKLTLFVIA